MGVLQKVKEPTHCFNHTLDLVLTYDIEPDNLCVSPLNPLLSDLITSKFNVLDDTMHHKKYEFSRCPSENIVNKFKEAIVSHLPMVEQLNSSQTERSGN